LQVKFRQSRWKSPGSLLLDLVSVYIYMHTHTHTHTRLRHSHTTDYLREAGFHF